MNNRITYIIVFLVSLAATVGIIMSSHPEWFWVTLPFTIAGLIKSFDAL